MGRLAEHLTPPYFEATLNEMQGNLKDDDHIAPADEMVTIAPRQPGFLGLETVHDKEGKTKTVSYWKDIGAIEGWITAGDVKINNRFGISLADTCGIRIALVDKQAHAGIHGSYQADPMADPRAIRGLGAFVAAGVTSLWGLLP